MAYRVIRQLNRELEERGVITVQGKVSRCYLIERFFGEPSEKDGSQCL